MNNPDENSSTATMNDLPNEMLLSIFKHLRIQDLFRCRLVCKRFMFFCDEVKIRELIVSDRIENFKEFWFHTNEQLNHKDSIDVASFKRYQSTFRLAESLKRLHFKGSSSDYVEAGLNGLTNLEQLGLDVEAQEELDVEIQVEIDMEIDYREEKVELDLPNLKILELGYSHIKFILAAPKLEMLKCGYYENTNIELAYPKSILHLETAICSTEELAETSLNNLRFLKVDDGFVPNRHILSAFPQLTTFVCNQSEYASDEEEEYDESIVGLRDLVEQKRSHKRHDFKIYYQSVEVADRRKIDEYESTRNILAFQMNNYDSLCDNVTYNGDGMLNYNELMELVRGELPPDFYKKFFNLKSVRVTKNVQSTEHLTDFLKSFDYLNRLHLERTSLDQGFYDSLPEIGQQLTELRVRTRTRTRQSLSPIVNYNFLLKLKFLVDFGTDVDFAGLLDLSLVLFSELKHFRCARFYVGEELISIGNWDGFFEFTRSKAKKRIYKKNGMDFDQLVDCVNAYRNSNSSSSNPSDQKVNY